MNSYEIDILLVEDNPGDVVLIQRSLRDAKVKLRLSVANDGVDAMAFLRKQGSNADAPRPSIILLDLNMPRMNGYEVLAELKEDPDLRTIPVIILTSSDADQDVIKAYQHHANCYISKPIEFDKFIKVIRMIEEFWLSTVRLPPN
jgi:CheY-like chemotaxis protein